jgi:CubicO group peptidase (beta-lactamase class C family)
MMVPLSVEAYTLSQIRNQEVVMAYQWPLVHLVWTLMALLPVLAQAAESTPAPGLITPPASRGADGAPLDAVLPAFEDYAERARTMWGTPGMAIAVVHRNQVVYTKGFGVKKLGGTDAVDPHTLFPIGSTSKAFTSALVALLADAGKLRWEDPVIDHVPAFEMYDPWVTRAFMIEDLMAQRSGMSPYAGDLLAVIGFDAPYIQAQIRHMQPVSSFRSRFGYVNNLFLVAAEVIKQHTGMTWEEAVQRRLFAPLDMTESSTGLPAYRSAANAAISHTMLDGQITAMPLDAPSLGWAYTYGPAGGVNSTVVDMAKWLKLHLGQGMSEGTRLISEANMQVVHSPKTVIEPQAQNPLAHTTLGSTQTFYCEGWVYSAAHPNPVIWHNGDTGGIHAVVGFIPAAQLGLVVLTNLGGTQLPEALLWYLNDLYFSNPRTDWSQVLHAGQQAQQAAARTALGEPPTTPTAALPLQTYTGTFHHRVYGDLVIETAGDSLTVTVGPRRVHMTLRHWNRDTFRVSWPENDAYLGASGLARFAVGPQGQPVSLTLDLFADVDQGLFVRVGSTPTP